MASTMRGECIKIKAFLVKKSKPLIPVDIVPNPFPGCCNDFVIKPLADASGNETQNDVNTIVYGFDPIVDTCEMVLQQWNGSQWVDQPAVTATNYGKLDPYGFYTNRSGQKFIRFEIQWSKVLALIGEGSYRVITTYHSPLEGDKTIDSYEFCLRTYTPSLADGTVRLDYWMSGQLGDIADDEEIKDYGTLSIYNTLRVNGFFGYPSAEYKEETIEYENGQSMYVEDEQTPVFELKLKLLPFFIHEIIRTDFMMANTMAITDYNSRNNGRFVKKLVRKNSGYKPNWYKLGGNLASVELQFKQEFNRLRKLR
jgi:hypothetical protein